MDEALSYTSYLSYEVMSRRFDEDKVRAIKRYGAIELWVEKVQTVTTIERVDGFHCSVIHKLSRQVTPTLTKDTTV